MNNSVTKIDSLAIAQGVSEVTEEQAMAALKDAKLDIDLKKWVKRKVVGKFLTDVVQGHIVAESVAIREQMERVRTVLMDKIESTDDSETLVSLVAAINDSIRNVAALSLVEMKAAEIGAVSSKGRKQNRTAPSVISETTYVQINQTDGKVEGEIIET